jgi:hypothetical protein
MYGTMNIKFRYILELLSHQHYNRITSKRLNRKEILAPDLQVCEFRVNSLWYPCVPKLVMVAMATRVYDAT